MQSHTARWILLPQDRIEDLINSSRRGGPGGIHGLRNHLHQEIQDRGVCLVDTHLYLTCLVTGSRWIEVTRQWFDWPVARDQGEGNGQGQDQQTGRRLAE